jgi:hypothetical protein
MVAGTTYTITMTTSGASWLSLWAPDETGALVFATMVNAAGAETVTLTYTATRTGYHTFYPGGPEGVDYTVGVSGSASSAMRAPAATIPSLRTAAPLRAQRVAGSLRGTRRR